MAVKAGSLESELIDRVCELIRSRLPEEKAERVEQFARQYYRWVPPEDLAGREVDDLYGATLAHFELASQRADGEVKVHVFNPDPERDGFAAPHTFVDIVSPDMPFIVDSVTMELARQGHSLDLQIHPVIWMRRDAEGELVEVLAPGAENGPGEPESVLHAEVSREHDPEALERLADNVHRVLDEVRAAVRDWQAMRSRALELAGDLEAAPLPGGEDEREEVTAFLQWMAADRFTFLGYREYELLDQDGHAGLRALPGSGLGILAGDARGAIKPLRPKALALARDPRPLVLTKANARSTVHRPSQLDYIGVKRFDSAGGVVGEARFLGLYTTTAYRESPSQIPLLRDKVERVLERSGFPPASHDRKALIEIVESYPRDALFQMNADDLFEVVMGLLGLGERPRVRLFVWHDPLDRFVSCLVTIPRDRFNTENRERVGAILMAELGGSQLDWSLQLSESLLARVHYIVRCPDGVPDDYDVPEIETRLARATRAWSDDLRDALIFAHGEEAGTALARRYERAFPPGYRSDWSAEAAVEDIARLEELLAGERTIIDLYRSGEEGEGVRCKLYSRAGVSLSDVVPTFEHMGARVIDERPYPVQPAGLQSAERIWLYDFGLRCDAEDLERVSDTFQEVFLGARRGRYEDDGLGGLVLAAALTGEEIALLRAVARYLRQAGIAYSDAYMERTLMAHPDIARLLVKLFAARFDPDQPEPELGERLARAMEMAIDGVESLDEDRILRSFLAVFRAMLRTSFYRRAEGDGPRPYLSFKLDPNEIPFLPKPRPQFEIFVYSTRFEAVHLRGGRVARGGLRWSDRPEDFRTEVLGLMKAQMVKNALIVPVGAKGGFVLKRPPAEGGPGPLREEAIACYKLFLRGMLDITDNIVEGEVVVPERVIRYDGDDTYLVVAADKGTATFSDIANEVSAQYGYWLGDAFASGGSRGYDHKQMGITARGAWESVKRHFRELGIDIQATDFSVVGVGDMSGDVFGNGMLLSPHIRLLAAFNHRHVFIDPDPDLEASFAERRRLFELEGSSWADYDAAAISEGGGVYERSAKSIHLSDGARDALGIEAQELSPAELIAEILKAPVDLLFNGGIGTYVKAAGESHADVGDKANDALRVDGRQLRCRVVGEGGNLGFTQRGRIEYALRGGPEGEGGRINTDSIDNVAGVNCSDHEVNIKILLDSQVHAGGLAEEERNQLLEQMTDAVGGAVIYACYAQTQAISLAMAQAAPMIDVHARLIRRLEQVAGLDRELEFLPSEEEISDRKAAHRGLVAPELAVVMAYCKIHLHARLLESDLPEDEHLQHDVERYFPAPLPERFREAMGEHRLRREIIATVVANQMVDRAGTTFAFRLGEETGASPSLLACAYAAAREVFEMRSFWEQVEGLDNRVDTATGTQMLIEGRRLVERASRWLAQSGASIDIERTVRRFHPGAQMLSRALPGVLAGGDVEAFETRVAELRDAGVSGGLAAWVASMQSLVAVFDIVEVADELGRGPELVMETYFRLGAELELNWLRDRIFELPRSNRWQALSRAALRDDLYTAHRELTHEVLGSAPQGEDGIEGWKQRNAQGVERCLATLADIRASRSYDTTTLPVALREVRALIRSEGDAPAVS